MGTEAVTTKRTFAEQLAWDMYHEDMGNPNPTGNWWDRMAPVIQRALDDRDKAIQESAERCAGCRYSKHYLSSCRDYYLCRRRAPVKVKNENGWYAWPNVTADDWCGDYEPATASPASSKESPGTR